MNIIEFLRIAKIEDLRLPAHIMKKLQDQNLTDFQSVYSSIQSYKALGCCSIEGLTDDEMRTVIQKYTDLMVAKGLMKPKNPPVRAASNVPSALPTTVNHRAATTAVRPREIAAQKKPTDILPSRAEQTVQPITSTVPSETPPASPLSPLSDWENRLAPQLRKVELIGEIHITKEELDEISLHLSILFHSHSEPSFLNAIERYYPATFMVFMVGQGIFGYNNGDFWAAYEQALRRSFDHTALGRLFEKLLKRSGKPQFRDLQERSMRYVSLVLAHGGIPVYCLKDFFNNIVLNCAIRPQLFALEGEELAEEVLKHASFTASTDKPVLYFLEYGGSTATNLLDRSRKMLLAWQQNQTLWSAEEAGLPAHITEYFAEWTRENTSITSERSSRNRLKRPQLSLDPWGLGIYLHLPSQPVSALNLSDLYWEVEAGNYHEQIKARTLRKGDQLETREMTLRLNEVYDKIQIRFSQSGNDFEWKIIGYSPDHLVMAFDPISGHIQNHILARETWLLFPRHFSLTVLAGEGSLIEILPDLPGEWSKLKLECWDLTQATCIGLIQNGEVFREIYVRSQEKIEQPSLEGGKLVPTDLEENPVPLYSGAPPTLHIPLGRSEDIRSELSRWQIKLDSVGTADPEVSRQMALADLSTKDFAIVNNMALIPLAASTMLTERPAGTYQIAIKGPLGRDASLTLQILPECEVSGLKELYIPDRSRGPEPVSFSIRTSLLAGVDTLNSVDGIKIETEGSGLHQVLVPPEVSSVGLLIRRETINHQFIRVPIFLRIKRLRWRLICGNGLIEDWMQRHSTLSLQELLQEESPLLIVDLPGNDERDLSLKLNLMDIHGNLLQQINPAEGSSKRANRFWRFDLSKIKNSMDLNDSPIFRVDIIGFKDAMEIEAFSLPVLVFTREIQIRQLQTEVYSSHDQHHILVTWNEKKPLRSRALILWSLFRPWQPPIIENIPDSAIGEYEFLIAREGHAEGIYRLQMVVVDLWAPSSPEPLPPAECLPGYHDMEISSPSERVEKLEKIITATTYRHITQFRNRIEISLIRQYMGEMETSYHDLEVCCCNLITATSREILTLRSILARINLTKLDKEFGEQIIQSDVLSRLFEDMVTGEITLLEFTSILTLATESKNWSAQSCEILVKLEDPKIRSKALRELVAKDISKAVFWIIKLLQESRLSLEDAVELLHEEKLTAAEQLKKDNHDPMATQLLDLLSRYNHYSGLPVVRPGSWVQTNAGWGRIEEIIDPHTRVSVDNFLDGDGKYILSVALRIIHTHDLTGEKMLVNMATGEITFPRANKIFICQHCQEFVTTKVDIFKNHLIGEHGNALPYPGEYKKSVPLSKILFNMNPNTK